MKSNIDQKAPIRLYWTFERGCEKVYRVDGAFHPEILQFARKYFNRPATEFRTIRLTEHEAYQLVTVLELLGFTAHLSDRVPLNAYKWQKGE